MEPTRTRVGAYCVVVDNGRLLLAEVAEGFPGAGLWTLPGGGVDWGEQPVDGALRELHEEAGLIGSDPVLLAVDSRSYAAGESLRDERRLHWVRLLYRVRASGDPQVLDVGGSTSDVAWFPLVEVPELPTVDLVNLALTHLEG